MPDVRLLTTIEAPPELLGEIRRFLVTAFEGDFSADDWEHTLGGRHVVVTEEDVVHAHAAVVSRTLEVEQRPFQTGYVEGVATLPTRRRRGLGSLAMRKVAEVLRSEFEMGALSTDRQEFYERHGWERWRGPSFVRRGSETIRTEDEDDGLMVLRFGRSADIDLTASLSCEARSGVDW